MEVFKRIRDKIRYDGGDKWIRIKTIDMHTGGEPLRVIVSGFPEPEGHSILEFRDFVKNNYDHIRTLLMHEPRGHADMYGCILTPPVSPEADFGIIFMHNEGYSTMCGHATIAIAKLAVEMKWVEAREPVTEIKIDAPCGLVTASVETEKGNVGKISFDNVPSFVVSLNESLEVEDLGVVNYDLAYGGAFYAFVNSGEIGIDLVPGNYRTLIDYGMAIKSGIMNSNDKIIHPFDEDLSFLYGTIFIGEPLSNDADSRNVCIFANGEVDRSPTGSGVSARMAIHHKRNELGNQEWMTIESIIGSKFNCCIQDVVTYGEYEAVIPRVQGTAYVIGQHEFLVDPQDPLKNGFIIR